MPNELITKNILRRIEGDQESESAHEVYKKILQYGVLNGGIGVGRMYNLTLTIPGTKISYSSAGWDEYDALKNLNETIKNKLWDACNDQDNGH